MKKLSQLNVKEDDILSRNDLKAIMAGSDDNCGAGEFGCYCNGNWCACVSSVGNCSRLCNDPVHNCVI